LGFFPTIQAVVFRLSLWGITLKVGTFEGLTYRLSSAYPAAERLTTALTTVWVKGLKG